MAGRAAGRKAGNGTAQEPKGSVYWIRDERQLAVLCSARRQEIGDHLTGAGPQSVKEIADALSVKPSALYHHLKAMIEVGLVREAGARVVNRRTEKLYDSAGEEMRYGISLSDPAHAKVMSRLNAVQCRQTRRDFDRGLEAGDVVQTGPAKNLRTFRIVAPLSNEQLAEVNRHLEAISGIMFSARGQKQGLLALSVVMAPVTERPDRD